MTVPDYHPQDGEVWQEEDGNVLAWDTDHWMAFGTSENIPPNHPMLAHPMRRMILADSTVDPEFLVSPGHRARDPYITKEDILGTLMENLIRRDT